MKDVFERLKVLGNLKNSQEVQVNIHKKITELFYNDLGQDYINAEYDEETGNLILILNINPIPFPLPLPLHQK